MPNSADFTTDKAERITSISVWRISSLFALTSIVTVNASAEVGKMPARASFTEQNFFSAKHLEIDADVPKAEPSPAVDLSVKHTIELWRNIDGGVRRGTRSLQNLDAAVSVDLARAIGWQNGTVFLRGFYNNGSSLSELSGDIQGASNIETGVRAARLYEAWIEQRFSGNDGSVKLGLYDLNSEFDTNESAALFLHSSHGIGAEFAQAGKNGPSIFPETSIALRADYQLNKRWLVRAALLDGVPGDPARPRSTIIKINRSEGALFVGELQFSDELTKAGFGLWRFTSHPSTLLEQETASEQIATHASAGVYFFVERKLPDRDNTVSGFSAWLRFGRSNAEVATIKKYLGLGIVRTGVLRCCTLDRLGLAVAHAQRGADYPRVLNSDGKKRSRNETAIEFTYRTKLNTFFTIQPSIQYIVNPGGDKSARDALIFGFRTDFEI